MPSGIIVKGIGGFYYVKTPEGVYECKARGVFRKDEMAPLPGDRVVISITDEAKKTGTISEICPRETVLVRPAVANITQAALVIALHSPEPDFLLLDKLLITAEQKGIKTIICINKVDLGEEQEYEKIARDYEKAGYDILPLSTKTGAGFDVLKEVLQGRVTVFAGQSGVGKSTILNGIMDTWVMQTGSLSEKIGRGKHTTRHAELIELEFGGFVVDTPGFSSYELGDLTHEELEVYYPEFEDYLNKCRFTGCSHITEPGCVIREGVDKDIISLERYERYIQFYNTLKQRKDYIYKKGKG